MSHHISIENPIHSSTHNYNSTSNTYQTWRTKQLQHLNPFHLLCSYHRTSTSLLKLPHTSVKSWRCRTGAPPRRSRFISFSWFFSVSYLMGLRYLDSLALYLLLTLWVCLFLIWVLICYWFFSSKRWFLMWVYICYQFVIVLFVYFRACFSTYNAGLAIGKILSLSFQFCGFSVFYYQR